MTDGEIAVAVEATHVIGRRVAAHARASDSVKRALRHGVDIIYHCDFADEEALDLLEAARDRVFTGPAFGTSCRTHNAMRKRGIRIVLGGDYGFAANPQGTNARDLEHFVRHFGFSPSEALQAATRTGGEIMKCGHELGLVRPGYLADLLLVDGDPLADVRA